LGILFTEKVILPLNLAKYGLGYIFGDFSQNVSGRRELRSSTQVHQP
jgi:hypothetical protein